MSITHSRSLCPADTCTPSTNAPSNSTLNAGMLECCQISLPSKDRATSHLKNQFYPTACRILFKILLWDGDKTPGPKFLHGSSTGHRKSNQATHFQRAPRAGRSTLSQTLGRGGSHHVGFPAATLLHLDHALRSIVRKQALSGPMTVCLRLQKCGFLLIPLRLRWASQSPMTRRIP